MTVVSSGVRTISRLGLVPICGLGKSQAKKTRLGGRVLKQPIGVGSMYFSFKGNDMSHPKNSNKHPVAQEALLTDATPFHELSHMDYESSLLEVRRGKPAKEALNLSSMLMGSALEIMTSLTDEGMTTCQIYGVRFLIEASAALVDASVGPVEYGNRQGGAQ